VVEVATESMQLSDAARIFFSKTSPRVITVVLVATVVARLALASWSWWDLLVPGIILAAQPFTEWNIHVFLLHFRPKTIGTKTIDPLVARKHREHHADPKDVDLIFIPLPALAGLVGGLALVFLLALPLARGVSALLGAYAMLFAYEWTHYLIHSSYKPRHAPYRAVWRAHRNHHFRNEHYWFGVTMHLADHVLGTYPDRSTVGVSPTARTLGIDNG
jgi:hypothetical protein